MLMNTEAEYRALLAKNEADGVPADECQDRENAIEGGYDESHPEFWAVMCRSARYWAAQHAQERL